MISPSSSLWVMMSAPTSRVETPHEVVQANCVRCHEGLVGDIGAAQAHGSEVAETATGCVHCHAGVGHGPMR